MITRIELTNFMSHEHTVIEPAAGLTVLIGPNNCGKSAIVAALQILCSNENSTYVMRHGAKECTVKVETDDGHAIEWRRKNSPSYTIDGQRFDRLRGSGLPDELHTALRLPKVEAGDDNDFDVHFGTQKSPIFLLGGSSANAARFFASSSDAIRLVEMQRRHREKLSHALREKTRLEVEAAKVNAALGTLEPVVDIEQRLVAARMAYDGFRQLSSWIEAAANTEIGLCIQFKKLEKHASQFDALSELRQPPTMVSIEPLEKLIETKVAAERRLRSARSRAEALRPLPAPPTLHDPTVLDRVTAGIATFTRNHARSKAQSGALSQVCLPPPMAEVEPLRRHIERLSESGNEIEARSDMTALLHRLREPPRLADELSLAASLAAIKSASRQVVRWAAKARTVAGIATAPPVADSSALTDLIRRTEEIGKQVRDFESASKTAERNLDSAAADVRSYVEGRTCPICGSALDAGKVIACATVGLGGHNHS